ncbi:Tetratricopeptide TPR_1 repeat-containing protein [Thalassoporum mexicanum PCC 7367]|uniref:tetratricopeptide repeat protein n=1 Tax=Thalassoporum mexicanum TaxID=3457544 RepID=UPI00029FA280|nr:tetratricopeptide repeat protein [Pseudanabaena sp. PCC 7367]AFY71027.1 Tetratricopeptide TPR_1 repeat-containing protein [Pseudanabaena sp. PCC 7367]
MAQEFYQRGLEKLQQGDRVGAISEFEQALQASPDPLLAIKVYYQRGLAHFDSGSLDAAIADYGQAIKLEPEVDTAARINLALALAHITAKAPEQAIAAAKAAVQLKPGNPHAWRILARAGQQAQQLAEAIANYKQAAKFFLQQGNQSASGECVDAAYKLQVSLNQVTEAATQARKVAQMQDLQSQLAQSNAFFTQILTKISAGKYQQVLADLNWLLRADARDAKAYAMRGVVYSKLGNYQQALQDLNQAVYLDGKDVQIKISRAVVRTELGDAMGAIADFSEILKTNPNLASAYAGRGLAYFKLPNYRQAIEDYSRALQLKPNDAEIYSDRAVARVKFEDFEGALQDYQKAASLLFEQTNYNQPNLTSNDRSRKYQVVLAKIKQLQNDLADRQRFKAAQLHEPSDQPSLELQQHLLRLVGGNQEMAMRLITLSKLQYPGMTEVWYWKKVIFDLGSEL